MDISKLRENDKPYVSEVIEYLKEQGLEVELAGSAVKGDKKYKDVDLLAKGSASAMANVVSGLQGTNPQTSSFPQRAADGLEYQVICLGNPHNYVGTLVDERFNIQIGETKIDLNLQAVLKLMDTNCDGEVDHFTKINPYLTKKKEQK